MLHHRSPAKPRNPTPGPASKSGRFPPFGVVVLVVLALSVYFSMRSQPSDPTVPLSVPATHEEATEQAVADQSVPDQGVTDQPTVADPDQQYRQLAVGTWQDFHHGKRTLILRQDGTATMIVELSGLKARLFTPRLQLDIVWSIEGGRMHRRTVGGVPADKVEFVNRRAGVAVAEPIVELTPSRMVLRDQNGSQDYHWQRVP